MNSKSLRRLAADHADLHTNDLPPNYLWPPSTNLSTCCDDLTHLTLHLAGPVGTPYSAGLFTLALSMPTTYPSAPPTARFVTRIWHPNVDEATGAVCVDALKSGWKGEGKEGMRLRDVLVIIGCLLVVPNPASALNEAAGKMCQEEWAAFEKRARLMTGIHAAIPRDMVEAVREARSRGEEKTEEAERKGEERGEVGVEGSKVNTGRRKGKAKAVMKDEEAEENTRTMEVSDDEDWIPSNPSLVDAFATGRDNAFGIKLASSGPTAVERDTAGAVAGSNTPSLTSGSSVTTSLAESTPDTPHRHPSGPPSASTSSATITAATAKLSSAFTFSSTASDLPEPHWLYQHIATHLKSSRSPESLKREKAERKRFKAAGYSVQKHNRGLWGPRTGLRRL